MSVYINPSGGEQFSIKKTLTSDNKTGEVGHPRAALRLRDAAIQILILIGDFLEMERGGESSVVDVLPLRHGDVFSVSPLSRTDGNRHRGFNGTRSRFSRQPRTQPTHTPKKIILMLPEARAYCWMCLAQWRYTERWRSGRRSPRHLRDAGNEGICLKKTPLKRTVDSDYFLGKPLCKYHLCFALG